MRRHWLRAASASSWAKAVAMKDDTTRRPLQPACAKALRMKCTRQRCQVAFRTFPTAALMPSWASEITSLTPRSPARELAQERGPERLRVGRADVEPKDFAPSVTVHADRDDRCNRDDAPVLAHLHVGGVDPQVRPIAFERSLQEGLHLLIDLRAQPRYLALGDAAHAHGLHQIVHRAGGDALDIGLLHHCRERFLGHPPRLEKAREVGVLAQLGNAKLVAGLPTPIAVQAMAWLCRQGA